ncbi:class I glutamine amidotransferase-like protein [Hyaloscypha variabilis F]|uniref:Class I glutamine amidotransferase-like protein n=1 Tax=Hyaloscypha variabilis (strain UAMH 11265 / GT02V1 / F) TaxID=1149755 RepID=A0A2J6RU25_HYAVF|nr:class I glutamine amidotransferase-like protein [Hyaloscypha variabilis F]
MATAKMLFAMADYGHDPTETAVPYMAFKKAGFEIQFATENGKTPECDEKMLRGITQKLLGANRFTVNAYDEMSKTPEFCSPLSWSSPDFSLNSYNLVFLPGGHEKGVRQVIDSPIMHKQLAEYFPATKKPSKKTVAAICHGVMVLSETQDANGKSIIHECDTTALPARFEQFAFWGTRVFLGDYYKTYGVGSDDVEVSVRKRLDDPAKQYKNSLSPSPFIVQDQKYNYLSGRFPNDAQLLAEKTIDLVKSNLS